MDLPQPQATATVASFVFVVTYALRRLPGTAPLWAKVPDRWRWPIPFVFAALTAFGEALQSGRGWAEAGQVALTAFFLAMGAHKWATDAPGSYNQPTEVIKP